MHRQRELGKLLGLALALALTASCTREDPPPSGLVARLHSVTRGIRHDMLRITDQTERLAQATTAAYSNADVTLQHVDTNQYSMTDYGGYYKTITNGRPALWVSGVTPVDDEVRRTVWLTEGIDEELGRIVSDFPEVAQSYYNDRHSMSRIYPPFDVLAQYEPRMDIPTFNFYYLADELHNPGRGAVWVDVPYVDPAGRGWMISSLAPVYVSNRVEGVVGLDITIRNIVSRYVSAAKRNIMLVDRHGVIIAADRYLIDLLELPPLKEHRYLETIKDYHGLPDDFNLLRAKTKEIRHMATQVLRQKLPAVRFTVRNRSYLILAEPVETLRWTALLVQPLD